MSYVVALTQRVPLAGVWSELMEFKTLPLGNSTLDRNALVRSQPHLIRGLLKDPKTLIIATHDSAIGSLEAQESVAGERELSIRYWTLAELPQDLVSHPDALWIYVGRQTGREVIALVVPTSLGDSEFSKWTKSVSWLPLRSVAENGDAREVELAVPVVALANWHVTALFCGRCGNATHATGAGWSRRCASCETEHFPRTDPAVIMAVLDNSDRMLLGNSAKWPKGRFSTLAGFVEPGENLDSAVRREVFEESGILVGETEFWGSQPWPFPASLMLGYFARAVSTDIEVDHQEIREARWFTRQQLLDEVAHARITLPGKISIARALIDSWLESEL